MLLQTCGRRYASLVNDPAEPPNDFSGHRGNIGSRQADRRLSHDFSLSGSHASRHGSLDETVQDQINEFTYLANVAPNLGLDGWIHFDLFDGQGDQLIQDMCNFVPFGLVRRMLAKLGQVQEPGSHVLQTQMFQF